jgi:hypothetical protein
MLGTTVTVKVTYCGHALQAEVEVNRQGDWIGRCVVKGPAFKGTVTLYAPLRTPTEALDAILATARHSVDEERGAASPRSPHLEDGALGGCPTRKENRHDD